MTSRTTAGRRWIAWIAALQAVSFRPFSRIRMTVSFSSCCDGDLEGNYFSACMYHEIVEA